MSAFVPEKISFSSFIGPHLHGKALLDFLKDRFTYFNAEQWALRIAAQDVLVNGKSCPGETPLCRGDEVQYIAMTRPEPLIPKNIPVLYEDADLLIVNKPPHLPVHPGGRYLRNTLINLLKIQRKSDMIILAHRLDRETSGVCVLTKTHMAKEKMYWQFFNNDIDKTYWALVWGRPHPPSGTIDVAIGPAQAPGSKVKSRIRIKQAVGGGEAKAAKTKYHTLSTKWIHAPEWTPPDWPALEKLMSSPKVIPGNWPLSLVECKPVTGRTNQIRVHLAHIGAGVVGDKLYDPSEEIFMKFKEKTPSLEGSGDKAIMKLSSELKRRLVLDAHALHAKRLEFRHPRTGKRMTVEAPAPKAWQGLYDRP